MVLFSTGRTSYVATDFEGMSAMGGWMEIRDTFGCGLGSFSLAIMGVVEMCLNSTGFSAWKEQLKSPGEIGALTLVIRPARLHGLSGAFECCDRAVPLVPSMLQFYSRFLR